MDFEKIVIVKRKTRLEGMVERFNTIDQSRFYVEHSGGNFDFYVTEHDTYYQALEAVQRDLESLAKTHLIERDFLPNYIFAKNDLVVTIGIDGQVVNTAKYLNGQPIVAVNPDPERIDGILLPFTATTVRKAVEGCLAGRMKSKSISMAEATLNDGQRLLAVNDLFIGRGDHISARYNIRMYGKSEDHSSSGVIVSTGVGETGWFSSFFNMVNGIIDAYDGQEALQVTRPDIPWDTERLYFIVREPFISKTSFATIVAGEITKESPMVIESHMPSGGVIFSDGIPTDFLEFNSGKMATISLSERQTKLVVP